MSRKKKAPGEPAKISSLQELAMKRIPKALKAIKLCGNLITRKPTEEQKEKIITALKDAVKQVENRFEGEVETSEFEL